MSKDIWRTCGLNADWCVQAWHYGVNEPNVVDGDYYVIDNEDGNFLVQRYYPSERYKEDHDSYKEVVFVKSFPSKREAMRFVEEGLIQ